MKLGCIADDFTGASDLGLTLAEGGMKVVQYVGVPKRSADGIVDAGVVALKSRSAPVDEAVRASIEALEWLRAQGCRQYVFKYCSTFDSTPDGNIGPVIEALLETLGTEDPVIACPAYPATGRTIYQGHLFVGARLLSESGMEKHPLTPMTDPNLVRWLGYQVSRPVGHVSIHDVRRDARAALRKERDAGRQIVVPDAIDDDDLIRIGRAAADWSLVTGGSGIALALPEAHGASGGAPAWRGEDGPALALAGSCSAATREQIAEHIRSSEPARRITGEEAVSGIAPETLPDWALAQKGLPVLYTSDDPEEVSNMQERYGRETISAAIESLMAALANGGVERGVRRLIVAGGETSGAVVQALRIGAMEIGPQIDPGVPALRIAGEPVVLALKSGNFGATDFFSKAASTLGQR